MTELAAAAARCCCSAGAPSSRVDLVSVPQALISRPLVAGCVAGWIAGDVEAGLRAGVLFELFALDVLPIGAVRYPDYGPATRGGGRARRRARPGSSASGSARARASCSRSLGGGTLQLVRRMNASAIQHRAAALAAGERSAPSAGCSTAGSRGTPLRGAVLTAAGLAAAWALARARPARPGHRARASRSCHRLRARGRGERRPPQRGSRRPAALARGRRRRRPPAGGAPMTGGWRALLRLFAVQGTWNYERMLGVGMGYAAEPLLEDLKTVDPVRHSEAVVRSTEFFNCHPNLAGLALGAVVRAEYDALPGAADRPASHRALQPARRPGRPALLGGAGARARRRGARRPWCSAPAGGRSSALLAGVQPRPARHRDLVAPHRARRRHAGGRPRSGNRGSPGGSRARARRPGSRSGGDRRWCPVWYLEGLGAGRPHRHAGGGGRRGRGHPLVRARRSPPSDSRCWRILLLIFFRWVGL